MTGTQALQEQKAYFTVGQVVHHRLFDYRGVVVDVDPFFRGAVDWYQRDARPMTPPKDRPWYHVLVDGAAQQTYVAERNLEADSTGDPVEHPDVGLYFDGKADSGYLPRQPRN